MDGRELLTMVVRKLESERVPPTDTAIVNKIRTLGDLTIEADKEWARNQPHSAS